MRNSVKACISKPSHRPLASRATVKACNCKSSHRFSLIFIRKRTFCERVNGKKGEIYVYSIVPTKPSPSIHRAFFKPSQATAWAAGTTWHSGFFTRLTGETSPGLEKTSPGLEKTSPGLVRTTLGLVAGGSDGARRKR